MQDKNLLNNDKDKRLTANTESAKTAKTAKQASLFAAEEAYLAETLAYIDARLKYLEANTRKREDYSLELKKVSYDEGLELKELEANGQFDSAMVQNELLEQDKVISTQTAESNILKKVYQKPYFGHIDFRFASEDSPEAIYIGLKDIIDFDNYKQFVVDWRAPIANLYYDTSRTGKASYKNGAARVQGDLEGKYQILIEQAKLLNVLDTDEMVNDEVLLMILAQPGSAVMKNIVETIQAEQNKIIRAEINRTLIVQGVAGSGKTSIALHRAAYMLYLMKDVRAMDMLIISPSASFAAYISNVLPSLGEHNINHMTREDLMREELGDSFERYYSYDFRPADAHKTQVLSSFKLVDYVNEFTKFFSAAVFVAADIVLGDDIYIPQAVINRLYNENYAFLPAWSRKDAMLEHIQDLIADNSVYMDYQEQIIEKIDAMYLVHTLTEVYQVFAAWLKTEKGLTEALFNFDSYDTVDLSILTLLKVNLFGKTDTSWVRMLIVDEMQDLLPVEHEVLRKLFTCPRTILGDEHQAVRYSPNVENNLAVTVNTMDTLNTADAEGTVDTTNTADAASTMNTVDTANTADAAAENTAAADDSFVTKLAKLYGRDKMPVETFRLNKSYRSTSEITEFAQKILATDTIQAVDRHGEAVEVREFWSNSQAKTLAKNQSCSADSQCSAVIYQTLLDWRKTGYKTAAIICKNAQMVEKVRTKLEAIMTADHANADLLLNNYLQEEDEFAVTICDIAGSKGIEFDAVIVYNASAEEYKTELDRTKLYVACTRPLHVLKIYALGQKAKFLPEPASE